MLEGAKLGGVPGCLIRDGVGVVGVAESHPPNESGGVGLLGLKGVKLGVTGVKGVVPEGVILDGAKLRGDKLGGVLGGIVLAARLLGPGHSVATIGLHVVDPDTMFDGVVPKGVNVECVNSEGVVLKGACVDCGDFDLWSPQGACKEGVFWGQAAP